KAIELGLKDPVVYNNRGKANYDLGNHKESIPDFSEAIKRDQNYVIAYENRGNAFFKTENYVGASKDLRMVEKLLEKPEPDLYHTLADSYYNMGQYAAAQSYYDKLIEAGVKDKTVFYRRGSMRLENEDYRGAIEDLE